MNRFGFTLLALVVAAPAFGVKVGKSNRRLSDEQAFRRGKNKLISCRHGGCTLDFSKLQDYGPFDKKESRHLSTACKLFVSKSSSVFEILSPQLETSAHHMLTLV